MSIRGLVATLGLIIVLMLGACGYIHMYSYDLDPEYLGVADCEIYLRFVSVDSERLKNTSESDDQYFLVISYQCLAADSTSKLRFENVEVSLFGGLHRTRLELADTLRTSWDHEWLRLRYGPYHTPIRRPESLLVAFDLAIPDDMALGAPRLNHLEIRGTFRDFNTGIVTGLANWH